MPVLEKQAREPRIMAPVDSPVPITESRPINEAPPASPPLEHETTHDARILYDATRGRLTRSSEETLDHLAATLKTEEGTILNLRGFTPGNGSSALSLAVVNKPLITAKNYLIAKGVPAHRLLLSNFGGNSDATEGFNQPWIDIYLLRTTPPKLQ